jgi:hypothetical protein
MIDFKNEPLLGVGILDDDPTEPFDDAIQITTFLLRYLAHQSGGYTHSIDLDDHLPRAARLFRPIDRQYSLHMAVLSATGPLQLPSDHLAIFTITTRYWKRGRARIVAAAEALIKDFLQFRQQKPEELSIQCVPHTRVRRYFSYQVFIRQAALS